MLSLFKKTSLLLAALLLFSNTALATTIGVINMQVISADSAIAKSAEAELEKTFGEETAALDKEAQAFQKRVADFQAEAQAFEKKASEFQKQSAALSEKARNEKAQALEKEAKALENKQKSFETDGREFEQKRVALANKISPRQQEMQVELVEIIREASKIYAENNNIDLIMDGTTSVIVSGGGADITNGIIIEMDKIWEARGSKFKN